jgi:hypothetical protein
MHSPGHHGGWWREHRTVCLPDFQGVGIGNTLSEFVGGVMRCLKKPYMSTTGNPAMIRHRAKSPLWVMRRKPSRMIPSDRGACAAGLVKSRAVNRFTAGFTYVGPLRPDDAKRLGII